MDMRGWKNKFKILTTNLKKRHNKLKIFNKKIESKSKTYKGVFLIQKWSGKNNSEIQLIEKMFKFKPFKILINNKSKNTKNWENCKVNPSKNKQMISFIPMRKSSKNCLRS